MRRVTRAGRKHFSLSLERLESRILLAAVNAGELALLADGDALYFIQGLDSDPSPSDMGGPIDPDGPIVIARFNGAGTAQFEDYFGHMYIPNGGKIGNIVFSGTDSTTSLVLEAGKFRQGSSMADVAPPLTDAPNTQAAARPIVVPPGENRVDATYNTGLGIVAAAGWSSPDWFQFAAEEAEVINVSSYVGQLSGPPLPGPDVNIYVQYPGANPVFYGTNTALIWDDNGDSLLTQVTVFLEVIDVVGDPYTLLIQRVEQNTGDWDGDGIAEKTTAIEDYPSQLDPLGDPTRALDITFDPLAPEFFLSGLGAMGGVTLVDRPDSQPLAMPLVVPTGQVGPTAEYNTGLMIVSASGADGDWYTFPAEEAEKIVAHTFNDGALGAVPGPDVTIYTQYGTGVITARGTNEYVIGDDNANLAMEAVTVYLHVAAPGGVPYAMLIERVEQDMDFDGDGILENDTVLEDFPNTMATAQDITWDPLLQTGFGIETPEFTLDGLTFHAAPLPDRPDTQATAFDLAVPSTTDPAAYTTERVVVAASGGDVLVPGSTTDWYFYAGEEAEAVSVVNSSGIDVNIWIQYGTNPAVLVGQNSYTIVDDGDSTLEPVTVYLQVPDAQAIPYTLVVDREEINDPVLGNLVSAVDDFPSSFFTPIDLTFNAANFTGIGLQTPQVNFPGKWDNQGGSIDEDYFKLRLQPGEIVFGSAFSNLAEVNVLDSVSFAVLADLVVAGQYQNTAAFAQDILLEIRSTNDWDFDLRVDMPPGPVTNSDFFQFVLPGFASVNARNIVGIDELRVWDPATTTLLDDLVLSGQYANPTGSPLLVALEVFNSADWTVDLSMAGGALNQDYFKFDMTAGWTLLADNFGPNVSQVILRSDTGGFLADLMVSGSYTAGADAPVRLQVINVGDWSFSMQMKVQPLSAIVERDLDNDGFYRWGLGTTPWIDAYSPPTPRANLFAPAGAGRLVVTGDISFDAAATGFGFFGLDGALKGSFGTPGATLGAGETIDEILLGYLHGVEGWPDTQQTTGGINTGGNVNRLAVRTVLGEIFDEPGTTDRFLPASITVGGYLHEVQTSGTLYSDIIVGGAAGAQSRIFDLDARVGSDELYLVSLDMGHYNDVQGAAYVVGSTSGDFRIDGELRIGVSNVPKQDPEDWYVFNAEMGSEITVSMWRDWPIWNAWVYAPSGRVVAVVTDEVPGAFVADEGGNYYIKIGEVNMPERQPTWLAATMDYTLWVTGTRPVHLGGAVAGSDIFGAALPANEFGDDMTNVIVDVTGNVGFLDARGQGNFADVNVFVTGDFGYATGDTMASADGDYASFSVGGDIGRLESRSGDLETSGIFVGGNLNELQSAGSFTGGSLPFSGVSIGGHVGSMVVAGDFLAQMEVFTRGIDLFWVGGDFGSLINYSSVATEVGTDVAAAYVAGTIYDGGLEVFPVGVGPGGTVFADDGGGRVRLTPAISFTAPGAIAPVPSLTYRYLPIGRPGVGAVGAVITEITTADSLAVTVLGADVDLGYVRFGNQATSYVTAKGDDRLAKLDIYNVSTTAPDVSHIVNNTFRGDIVNVSVGNIGRIVANGHIGITDRFFPEGGRLINPEPTVFAPPAVQFVAEANPARFNGVVASGTINLVQAGGSIGDVYAGGAIMNVVADSENRANGSAFSFRGMVRPARSWDGIAGVIYAVGGTRAVTGTPVGIGYVDPGAGFYGGLGEVPIGGLFTDLNIVEITARDSELAGPIVGLTGIGSITGRNTVIRDAVIDTGPTYSDWALWDTSRVFTTGMRLGELRLSGAGSIMDGVYIEVGVVDTLYFGPQTDGIVASRIFAVGDPTSEEGINSVLVKGGGIDGTDWPLYSLFATEPTFETSQRIGSIRLTGTGVDMVNADIRSLKSLDMLSIQSNMRFTRPMLITAPLFVGTIQVGGDVVGSGALHIGTGTLRRFTVRGDVGVPAGLSVDGATHNMRVAGSFRGDFQIVGPDGFLKNLTVRNGITGDVNVLSYIGRIDVRGGMTGQIVAGGANEADVAIGTVRVRGGLTGGVHVVPFPQTLRPGGGIGTVLVMGGDLGLGGVSAVSTYDPLRDVAVRADVGSVRVVGGSILGDVTVAKNDPGDPNDPGGDLGRVNVTGGGISGQIDVDGSLRSLSVRGGDFSGGLDVSGDALRVTLAGSLDGASVDVGGEMGRLNVRGSVLDSTLGFGSLRNALIRGDYTDSDIVGDTLGRIRVSGQVSSGTSNVIRALGGTFRLTVGSLAFDIVDSIGQMFDGVHAFVG